MSTAAFPTLPGLAWPVQRSLLWQTRTQQSVSGKRLNLADWSYPKRRFGLTYNFLRGSTGPSFTEWQTMEGFFNSRFGSWDSFLYTDPRDYSVDSSTIGTGDSTDRDFQLSRVLGSTVASFSEPVTAPLAVSAMVVAGTSYTSTQFVTQYWGSTAPGMITFSTFAPSTGQAIVATFTYAWPVSFDSDTMDFSEFVRAIWDLKGCSFTTLK